VIIMNCESLLFISQAYNAAPIIDQ
jgi:hypothetical protein